MLAVEFFSLFNSVVSGQDTSQETLDQLTKLCSPPLYSTEIIKESKYKYDKDNSFFVVGGEALVLKVYNLKLNGRPEIFKITRPEKFTKKRTIARFIRGSVLQWKLQHTLILGIPQVYDLVELPYSIDKRRPFPHVLKMEYIKGFDLLEYLKKIDRHNTLIIFLKICQLIGKIHECKIIHRDIKAQNFLVYKHPTKNEIIPVLIDFGIAKKKDGGEDMTGIGAEMGTRAYASKTQWLDAAKTTYKDEIYSLGCLLYVCLTFKNTGILPRDENDYSPENLPGEYLHIFFATRNKKYKTVNELIAAISLASNLNVDNEKIEFDPAIFKDNVQIKIDKDISKVDWFLKKYIEGVCKNCTLKTCEGSFICKQIRKEIVSTVLTMKKEDLI